MADGDSSSSFDISSFDWNSLATDLDKYNVPEICLIIAGIVALLIVALYLKDKQSGKYKLAVLLGVIVGIVTAAVCLISAKTIAFGTVIIICIGCFALIIRPVRDVHFALIIAIMGMVITFMLLGNLKGGQLDVLSTGWVRIVVAFVVGAIIYMLLGFLEAVVLLVAKFLNAWPVLGIVGILCIVEGILILNGYGSIYDLLTGKVTFKVIETAIMGIL